MKQRLTAEQRQFLAETNHFSVLPSGVIENGVTLDIFSASTKANGNREFTFTIADQIFKTYTFDSKGNFLGKGQRVVRQPMFDKETVMRVVEEVCERMDLALTLQEDVIKEFEKQFDNITTVDFKQAPPNHKLLAHEVTTLGLLDTLQFSYYMRLNEKYEPTDLVTVTCTAVDVYENDMYTVKIEYEDGSKLKADIDSSLNMYNDTEVPLGILNVIKAYMVAF